jgi:hypothetical protein
MSFEGVLTRAPAMSTQWANYYLTERGNNEAAIASGKLDTSERERLCTIATYAAHASFTELLSNVYRKAPKFAKRSVLKGLTRAL